MSNIILRNNGIEFFNLNAYSTITITAEVYVTNYSSAETIITVPRIPVGTTPCAFPTDSNVPWPWLETTQPSYTITTIMPDKIKVVFANSGPSRSTSMYLYVGYY